MDDAAAKKKKTLRAFSIDLCDPTHEPDLLKIIFGWLEFD